MKKRKDLPKRRSRSKSMIGSVDTIVVDNIPDLWPNSIPQKRPKESNTFLNYEFSNNVLILVFPQIGQLISD